MSQKLPIVTIIGRPNAGKSSLFNRLLGERKAIVHDAPGTTRDRVEAIVEWQGKQFWLVDTAGMEADKTEFAQSVQNQVEIARDQADIIVVVVDGSTIISDEDASAIKQAQKSKKPVITAINKADRAKQPIEREKLPEPQIPVSAIHGTGSGDLMDAITEAAKEDFPSEEVPSMPVLSLLGRPNVGKSSILNALAGHERAIISSRPGTTRDVTEIQIPYKEHTWQVADTAGLRRKTKADTHIERFGNLRAMNVINASDVCALVLDATELVTAQDQRIAGMIKEAGKGMIIVVNKWDQTERTDQARNQLENMLAASFQFVWWAPLLLTAAPQKHNVDKLLPLADQTRTNHQRTIQTKHLNEFLQTATTEHPPAGLKNKHPKLKYMTQTDTSPPTFAVFGRHTPYLHWSYKRYLETRLREEFDFNGTPIRLQWREKDTEEGKKKVKGKRNETL